MLGPLLAPPRVAGWLQENHWGSQIPRSGRVGAARRTARARVPPLGSPLLRRGVPMRLRGPQPCEPSRACPGLSGSSASALRPRASAASPGRARRPLVAVPRVSRDLWPDAARLRAGLLLAPGASSRRPASITAGAPGRKAGPEMRGLLKGQHAFSRLPVPARATTLRATREPSGAKDHAAHCVLVLFFCRLWASSRPPNSRGVVYKNGPVEMCDVYKKHAVGVQFWHISGTCSGNLQWLLGFGD